MTARATPFLPLKRVLRFLAAQMLKKVIRSSLRTGLNGMYLRGELPQQGGLIAANHHSWWDGYLAAELAWGQGWPFGILMNEQNLTRFSFFRVLGVLGSSELRPALRRLQAGEPFFIYPEGDIKPIGPLHTLQKGTGWLAQKATVPIYPLAVRVILRGSQLPEAYLWLGKPVLERDLAQTLSGMLERLDTDLLLHDPERPLPGFEALFEHNQNNQSSREGEGNAFLNHWLKEILQWSEER
jgi:1-acyl-sn-glycerol-3-phosphate acyltransferase